MQTKLLMHAERSKTKQSHNANPHSQVSHVLTPFPQQPIMEVFYDNFDYVLVYETFLHEGILDSEHQIYGFNNMRSDSVSINICGCMHLRNNRIYKMYLKYSLTVCNLHVVKLSTLARQRLFLATHKAYNPSAELLINLSAFLLLNLQEPTPGQKFTPARLAAYERTANIHLVRWLRWTLVMDY